MIKIERLNAMRMRTDDEIDSVIDQPAGEFALPIRDHLAVFGSPVNQASDEVCV